MGVVLCVVREYVCVCVLVGGWVGVCVCMCVGGWMGVVPWGGSGMGSVGSFLAPLLFLLRVGVEASAERSAAAALASCSCASLSSR